MDIFDVTCPECKRAYYGDMLLYSLNVQLHCPYCGKDFYKEESPRVVTGGSSVSAVARVAGGITEQMIFHPGSEEKE